MLDSMVMNEYKDGKKNLEKGLFSCLNEGDIGFFTHTLNTLAQSQLFFFYSRLFEK